MMIRMVRIITDKHIQMSLSVWDIVEITYHVPFIGYNTVYLMLCFQTYFKLTVAR